MTDVLFRQLAAGPMQNFSYLFGRGGEAVLVDPGFESERLLAEAAAAGLRVTHVLVTHGHFDHVQEVDLVRERTGARVVAHPQSRTAPDVTPADGETVTLAGVSVRAVYTPGHEPTSVCWIVADKWLLTGDTLFVGECGRADLPGSDPEALWDSLLNRLAKLPGDLVVCPGHDYGATPTDTLANQVRTNDVLAPRTREAFAKFVLS